MVGFHGVLPPNTIEKGGVKALFTDYDVWGSKGGAAPFYFSEKFVQENPDVVRRFVKALADANNWINDNPKEAEKIQAERLKVPLDQVVSYYNAPNGLITEDEIDLWIEILERSGDIKKGQVKATDIFTNEFNPYYKNK